MREFLHRDDESSEKITSTFRASETIRGFAVCDSCSEHDGVLLTKDSRQSDVPKFLGHGASISCMCTLES